MSGNVNPDESHDQASVVPFLENAKGYRLMAPEVNTFRAGLFNAVLSAALGEKAIALGADRPCLGFVEEFNNSICIYHN